MINNLRTRLILLTVVVIVLTIAIISIITNITLFRNFNAYKEEEQQSKIQEIITLIANSYLADNSWEESNLDKLKLSPAIENFDILIKDNTGNIVFNHIIDNRIYSMHNTMMKRMRGHMMGRMGSPMMGDFRESDYISDNYIIKVNEEKVGTVEIGYAGPFFISEGVVQFTRGINMSILYAAIISLIVAVMLVIYFSNIISKPILAITNAANNIRKGKLDTQIVSNNKITELQQLSYSINHLTQSLGQQEALRQQLTSDISHELRTPLTILQSHIDAMIDGVWEPTEERLVIFKGEILRLIKLVEQLKNLNDIENHRITLNLQPINISKMLKEVLDGFYHEFENKQVSLEQKIEEVFISGDEDRLKQVVINILSNALKFTEPGDKVSVFLKKSKDNAVLEIQDTGIGIPKEDLPYVFERFYRSDKSRSRKTGGSGIGLTLAKTLVEAHQGSIEVESTENEGATITIRLPLL